MIAMLPSKTVPEAKVITWDFTDEATGTLSAPSIAKEVIVGSDPLAVSLSISAPVILGFTVSALVSSGSNDCSYVMTCSVNDSAGQVHQSSAAVTTLPAVIQ